MRLRGQRRYIPLPGNLCLRGKDVRDHKIKLSNATERIYGLVIALFFEYLALGCLLNKNIPQLKSSIAFQCDFCFITVLDIHLCQ